MAIGNMFTDPRDAYGGVDYYRQQEQEWQYRRMQEEQYRKMQNAAYYNPAQQQAQLLGQQAQLMAQQPQPHLKDPLAFLQNTDKKLLLTGEMQ